MITCILYAQNQLITYTDPGEGVELKDDFTVRVSQSGSGWKEGPVRFLGEQSV